jgi:hypothetical protein
MQTKSREEKGCLPLLPLPNPAPHPASFHINLLVFSKNEIVMILLFAVKTTWSFVLVSIYYITTVTVTDAARVLS